MAGYIQDLIIKHLNNIKTEMAVQMQSHGRNASGKSVASLEVQPFGQDGGRIIGLKSWWAMERGRKGGKVPANFHAIIRQWIIDKGISVQSKPYIRPELGIGLSPEERGLRSMTGAIVHSIMRNGTRLHKTGGFDDIYSSVMEKELAKIDAELRTYLSRDIRNVTRTLADGTIQQYNTID